MAFPWATSAAGSPVTSASGSIFRRSETISTPERETTPQRRKRKRGIRERDMDFNTPHLPEPDEKGSQPGFLPFAEPLQDLHQERGMEPGEGPLPAEEIDFPHGCFLEERREVRGGGAEEGGGSA